MKEALITKAGLLQKVLELDLSKLRDFSATFSVSRHPVAPSDRLPDCSTTLPKNKTLQAHMLIAHILNFHIKTPDLCIIEATQHALVIHYRPGKEKEAQQAIAEALKAWTPLENWQLIPSGGNNYLQCSGYTYLPYLIAFETRKTLEQLSKDYALETTDAPQPQKVLCRRKIDLNNTAKLPEVATLLTDTHTRIAQIETLKKFFRGFCKELRASCPASLSTPFQNISTLILRLFDTFPNAKEHAQSIETVYASIAKQNPAMAQFLEKHHYQATLRAMCHLLITAEQLNQFADTPVVPLDLNTGLLTPIMESIVSVVRKLRTNDHTAASALTTFKSCEPEINAFFKFYCSRKQSEEAKTELSKVLLSSVIPLLNNCLHDITFTAHEANDGLETLLRLTDAITIQLHTRTNTEKTEKSEKEAYDVLHEDAISSQFAVLTVLMKFYRVLEKWDLATKTSERYFELLKIAPPATVQHRDKTFVAECVRIDLLLAQEQHEDAFSHYKILCNYFTQEDIFYVVTFGERLIEALTKPGDNVDILIFANETIAKLLARNCGSAEVLRFKSTCEQMERQHVVLLMACHPTLLHIEEETFALVLYPEDLAALQSFKKALKECGISSVMKEDHIKILYPLRTSVSQLEKALALAPRLKIKHEEEQAKKAAQAEKNATETTFRLKDSQMSSDYSPRFFQDPTVKIGLQKRERPKKSPQHSSDGENKTPSPKPKEKKYVQIDFGDGFVYDERLGTDQHIIALENGHHGFGTYFGFIEGDHEAYRAQLEKGKIAGPRGQKGMRIEKTNDGKSFSYKMKIMEEHSLIGEEFKITKDGQKLIRFYEPKTHPQMSRLLQRGHDSNN